jgi:hypothetical protein
MSASSTPRSVPQLVVAAFRLYRRYPLLFFILAVGVVVPYQTIVFAVSGTGPFAQATLDLRVSLLLTLIEMTVIGPLISALHAQAVREVSEGRTPQLVPVARQGLRVLPVVAAASIIAGLGIGVGFVLFIVPGVILTFRWYVVAQAAAIEQEGWLPALRSSRRLTAGHYLHIFAFSIVVALITVVPTLLIGSAFGHHSTSAASFLVAVTLQVFTRSFGALAAALLYFDLRFRHKDSDVEASVAPELTADPLPAGVGPRQTDHSWDPRMYSDEDRPNGWYVAPSDPGRMQYWGGEPPIWGATTRTPRKIRRSWEKGA